MTEANRTSNPLVWDGLWAEVEHQIQEIDWYASRKIDLARTAPKGDAWSVLLADDLRELREAIDAARKAEMRPVETTAPLSEADEVQIGRSQAELAVLKKDGRSYEVRRIAGQALEVITRLNAAHGTFGEIAQLRRIDRAARKFVDDFKSDALKAYVGWEELNKALFDGRPFTEEPSPEEPVAPPSGEVVLPGRLGHTAWCRHTLTVELKFKAPSPCNCGAALPAVKASEDPRMGEVRALMQAYRKGGVLSSTDRVSAVRLYRAIHGCSLKEAVFACDAL